MTEVLQPKVAVNILGANTVIQNTDQKILFVGQISAGATATTGSLNENVQTGTEDGLFGPASMLSAMVRTAREVNPVNQFDVISLADNGGATDATGTVVFTGTATAAGSYVVSIGSERNHTYSLAVASGDTATVIGDALVAAIVADTHAPVTSANVTGTVTLTAVNGGTLGNAIGISVSGSAVGTTIAIGAGMASGATDPVLTAVFDIIGDNRYQGIVWPYFADTTEVVTLLEARFNATNKVLDGSAFTASVDTLSNNLTRLNALNSKTLVDFVSKTTDETLFKGPDQLELLYLKSSQFAAIRAIRLSSGESISQYVISSNGALDSFGGPALASKPYFNTPLALLPSIQTGRGWTDIEIEQLHDAGGTVIGNNSARNAVIAGEVVTTYKNDPAGNPDISFKYLNYVDTSSNAREYFFNNLRARFAQSRLTEGDVLKGRDMANALVIQNFCVKLYSDLSGPNFVLLEAGEAALVFFKTNIVVTISKATGTATIQMTTPLVTQLREILATMKIAFSTEG